jgi:hypothetical protein
MPSSVVANLHYNPDTKDLTVIFVSGSIYIYKNVPDHVFISFKTARSKGRFLNRVIKDNYDFEMK